MGVGAVVGITAVVVIKYVTHASDSTVVHVVVDFAGYAIHGASVLPFVEWLAEFGEDVEQDTDV